MTGIGHGIHPNRSMSHYLRRCYTPFNHPKTAQRECAIMLLLKSKPMYGKDIAQVIGCSYYSVSQTLTALKKAHLIRKERRWYLEEMQEQIK